MRANRVDEISEKSSHFAKPIGRPAALRHASTDEDERPCLCLIDVRELSRITGLSAPTLWRHHEAGLIPQGVKIGRAVRWRLAEINEWIELNCPHRHRAEPGSQ